MPYLKSGDAVTFYDDPLNETGAFGTGYLISFVSTTETLETWIADQLILEEGEGEVLEPGFIQKTWQFKKLVATPTEESIRAIETVIVPTIPPVLTNTVDLIKLIDERIAESEA